MEYREDFHSLEEAIKDRWGEKTEIQRIERLSGGDINEAYGLQLSSNISVFVKMNTRQHRNFFLAEAAGLEALRCAQAVRVPKILGLGTEETKGKAFLLLEYVESQQPGKAYWEAFGRQMAMLHRWDCGRMARDQEGRSGYGFWEDNYIGATPQKNSPRTSWIAFYRDCRLAPQLCWAERFLGKDIRKKAEWLMEHLEDFLREPEFPSLLHGDLWSGNIMCGRGAQPWIIDPAVYVGDCEADLAMTQLFGGLPPVFYQAYEEINPIDWKEYEKRRDLYHLYHLLNHLNLFGAAYLGSVCQVIDKYAG